MRHRGSDGVRDFVLRGGIGKGGDGDGVNLFRQRIDMPGNVIPAGSARNQEKEREPHYSTSCATSIAFCAAKRRLSAATQSHMALA